MKFLNSQLEQDASKDEVFELLSEIAVAEKNVDPKSIYNGTIGSLYGEDGRLVAYQSVYDVYDSISNPLKAKYASRIEGNANFIKAVEDWLFVDPPYHLYKETVATVGGTGALGLSFQNYLDAGETVLLPNLGWNNYESIVRNLNLEVAFYEMFNGDHFHIDSFQEAILHSIQEQKKAVILMNDPVHNPTGYSLSLDEWKNVVQIVNQASLQGEVILIVDVAYIDYSTFSASRAFLKLFDNLSENVFVSLIFSCSKSLTIYGMRLGSMTLIHKKKEVIKAVKERFVKAARCAWSNSPQGAMELFARTTDQKNVDQYLREKQSYMDLLAQRSNAFISGCKQYGIKTYPHIGGFFATLFFLSNEQRDQVIRKLKERYIYLLRVPKGIRVGLCALNIEQCQNLPAILAEVYQECKISL